ncbi:polyisoprenoid-binding protein [Mucilaginibacter sp. PPCGB 2223]|uniref:YceI family protein n=1 Tax=Mucilaginibacter sp. PPCGB 2223 TaxID=1886027 RepID=UPI0008255D3F|nr:YceI family protein [Mucilaginibacter sp. PPCGB 2223]OCX50246.1 polyisoprenoid-binding protein [Mucilaginibacter sp. PPCGB 2223]
MKIIGFILLAGLSIFNQAGQGIFVCKNARITLFSKAPIEDIEAKSEKGTSVYNSATGDLVFSVPVSSFVFQKSLMQEHFNENYMESDKYPTATFKGKVSGTVDVTKDGSYPVNATGVLTVHGVSQNRTIPGTITVKGGVVSMSSEFMVKCVDHKITIPTIVFHNIAESIKITVSANYDAYKK